MLCRSYSADPVEILCARAFTDFRPGLKPHPEFTLRLDDWNRTQLMPKVYATVSDGDLDVHAEVTHDFEVGATREQIQYIVKQWLSSFFKFSEWVLEREVEYSGIGADA
jgi:hypothetical protein